MPIKQASDQEKGLRHQLSAGQMAMVGVGGSIGTGLLLGSGAAIQIAGPALILTYLVGAFLAWTVTNALGELASAHPGAGSFGLYADLYLNPWAGFVARYGYWFAIAVAVGAELVAASTYSRYWFPGVPGVAWVVLYAALLLLINLRPVGDYGSFEFWFAMIKVVTIVVFVVAGSSLLLGGRVTPQYVNHGGFIPNGPLSPLLAISFALFSFLGLEMVAISSGEARAAKEIPRATKIMFALLTFVYVGATVVLVGFLPWNRAGVTESPFVTVFVLARIPAAPTVMNFVVLTAALSGANANLYAASRMMFSLARSGHAAPALGRLNASGSPRLALLVSGIGVPLALITEHWAPRSAFLWLIGSSLAGGMLAWCVGLAAHMAFRRRLSPAELAGLAMRAPGGAAMSAVGLAGILLAVASTWWVPQSRITIVSGLPYLAILSLAYAVMRWRRGSRQKYGGEGSA
ncbi:MAG TPA: amino acid permease [Terracidiphilus sp.]|nr:amino acid permease [Terracidiphilus sp.]